MQLVDIRDDIRQAIADKGVDMTGTIPLSEYPGKIAEISTREYPGYKVKNIHTTAHIRQMRMVQIH